MLSRHRHFIGLSLCLFIFVVAFSRASSLAGVASQGDGSQAAGPLQTAIRNAGWARDWSNATLKFTATLTPSSSLDPTLTSVPVSGEFHGRSKIKFIWQSGNSTTTSIVNGHSGWVTSSKGILTLPFDALCESLSVFPFLSDMTGSSDAAVTISDDGITAIGSVSTRKFTFHRAAATDFSLSSRLSMQPTDTRVWLSPDTMLPIGIETYRPGAGNTTATALVRREFGDYRVVNGISVPFTIREYLDGNLIGTYSIGTIQFDIPLPDSEFSNLN